MFYLKNTIFCYNFTIWTEESKPLAIFDGRIHVRHVSDINWRAKFARCVLSGNGVNVYKTTGGLSRTMFKLT